MSAIQLLLEQVTYLNSKKESEEVFDLLIKEFLAESNNAELYYQVALAYENLEEYYQAVRYYQKAFTLDNSMARAYAGAGRASDAMGKARDAIKMFDKAIVCDPGNAEYHYLRGDCKGRIKTALNEAIIDLTEAIKLDPRSAKALLRRAEILFLNKKYEEVMGDLKKAISLQPELTHAYVLRGLIWYEKENYNKAITDYDIAIRQNPNDAHTWYLRAGAWLQKDDYDNCINDVNRAISLNPNETDFYKFRADCNNALNEYDLAIKDYAAAVHVKHDQKQVWKKMAEIFNEQKKYHDPECQYPVEIKTEDLAAYYFTIGFACYHLKDYYEAHVHFNKAIWLSDYKNPTAETWRTQTKKRIKETPGVYGHRQQVREQAANFLKELRTQYADKFQTSGDGFVNEPKISKLDANNRPVETGLLGWLPAFRPDIAKWEEFWFRSTFMELKVVTLDGEEFYPHLAGIPIKKILWEEIIYCPTDSQGRTIGRVQKFDRIGEMLDDTIKLIRMGQLDHELIFPDTDEEEET